MTQLPDTKGVIEIIYRYRSKSMGTRDFYLEGEEVKKFMQQIGSASLMTFIHGGSFEPLDWKVRKLK